MAVYQQEPFVILHKTLMLSICCQGPLGYYPSLKKRPEDRLDSSSGATNDGGGQCCWGPAHDLDFLTFETQGSRAFSMALQGFGLGVERNNAMPAVETCSVQQQQQQILA